MLFGFAWLIFWFSYVKTISCHILWKQFESTMSWEKTGLFLGREIMQKQFKLGVQCCKMTKNKALYSRKQMIKILQLFPGTRRQRHHGMNHQGIIFRQTVSIGRGPAIFLSERLKKRILYHFPLCWTRICLEALLDRLAPIPTMICAAVKQECLMHGL